MIRYLTVMLFRIQVKTQVYYLITVFMVLETGIVVHETVQLLKTFVLLFCL